MGCGSYSRALYSDYSASVAKSSREEVFKQRSIHKSLDPQFAGIRESRDSADHPDSTPIMFLFDITGSMGMVPEYLIKTGVGRLVDSLFETLPVNDPQFLFGGLGDIHCDRAPLQVAQFESDNRMVEQLGQVFLEGCGGGNNSESYDLAWYFAAYHTATDSFDLRGKKGYLFTTGDELFPNGFSNSELKSVFGSDESIPSPAPTADSVLAAAQKKWNAFHLIIEQGSYARRDPKRVVSDWREHMGKRAVLVDNYEYLPEIVVAVIRANEGEDPETIIADLSSVAAKQSVRHALFD
jgi:hypothetical protein